MFIFSRRIPVRLLNRKHLSVLAAVNNEILVSNEITQLRPASIIYKPRGKIQLCDITELSSGHLVKLTVTFCKSLTDAVIMTALSVAPISTNLSNLARLMKFSKISKRLG